MENKSALPKQLYSILALVLIISTLSVFFSALTLFRFGEFTAEKDEGTTEDGVVIANDYTVESTTHISDAYKSGDSSSLSEKDRETLDMATAVLDEVIKDNMSDFDKEKAVYDWLVKSLGQDRGLLTVIPTSGEDSDNPYGVLKYRTAVCVGYATTFRLFMQMMDIPCMVVHETSLYHTWDLVQIEGSWYHVDAYSGTNNKSYRYFNMPDSMCMQSWDREFFPKADSWEYNYAAMGATKLSDPYKIPETIRKAMEDKESLVSVKYPKSLTEEKALIINRMLSNIQDLLWTSEDYSGTYMDYNWQPMDDGFLYVVSITYDSNSPEGDISEEDQEKIDNAVREAFKDLTGEEESEEAEVSENEE